MAPEMYTLPQPGPHLVAIDLHIVEASSTPELGTIFAKESLCVIAAEKGAVTIATDFKPDKLRPTDQSIAQAGAYNSVAPKVEIAMDKQNRDILGSMSERAPLQLRLQQTVEGLSIAAVSYHVVGLLGYLHGRVPYPTFLQRRTGDEHSQPGRDCGSRLICTLSHSAHSLGDKRAVTYAEADGLRSTSMAARRHGIRKDSAFSNVSPLGATPESCPRRRGFACFPEA
ncbi:DUF3422 family protein [Rhizobium leguminosarum]|uniref:DUF3422 family protein n=1 Tax=Rhizobium leguminosarum TaxID=384 RepID=A0A7K3VN15_RHILE|nr:DUF3422 family protein [Rhizobium leguminosarum]